VGSPSGSRPDGEGLASAVAVVRGRFGPVLGGVAEGCWGCAVSATGTASQRRLTGFGGERTLFDPRSCQDRPKVVT
jgi:hypothetical protein